jgi:hypothetical protein
VDVVETSRETHEQLRIAEASDGGRDGALKFLRPRSRSIAHDVFERLLQCRMPDPSDPDDALNEKPAIRN